MRKALLSALLVLAIISMAHPSEAETYISAYGGAYLPSDAYDSTWEDFGLDAGASYTMINEYTGLEFSLHGYSMINDAKDMENTTLGAEVLVHFQKENATLQPFIAAGIGFYRTTFSSNYAADEKYDGRGGIIKAGVRLFMTDSFFAGLFVKHFSNRVNLPGGTSYNLGGDSLNFELGFVIF